MNEAEKQDHTDCEQRIQKLGLALSKTRALISKDEKLSSSTQTTIESLYVEYHNLPSGCDVVISNAFRAMIDAGEKAFEKKVYLDKIGGEASSEDHREMASLQEESVRRLLKYVQELEKEKQKLEAQLGTRQSAF